MGSPRAARATTQKMRVFSQRLYFLYGACGEILLKFQQQKKSAVEKRIMKYIIYHQIIKSSYLYIYTTLPGIYCICLFFVSNSMYLVQSF